MTVLLHNTVTACPSCGCNTVVGEAVQVNYYVSTPDTPPIIRLHVNGTRWETRSFLCGYVCEFTPNFLRTLQTRPCINDPEVRAKLVKKRALDKEISDLQAQLRDIDGVG